MSGKRNPVIMVAGILVMSVICSLAVSCRDDAASGLPQGVVGASVEISDVKAITVSVEDEVKTYEYRAVPQFSIQGEAYSDGIFGEQLQWREIQMSGRKASLGYYRQGLWVFEMRTKNKNGEVLTTGNSGEVWLQKGKANLVEITLKQDDGEGRSGENLNTGRIAFGLETNMLDGTVYNLDHAYIRIEADKLTTEGTIDGRYTGMRLETSNTCGLTLKSPGFVSLLEGEEDDGILAPVLGGTVGNGRTRYYGSTPDLSWDTKTVVYEDVEQEVHYWAGGVKAGQYLLRILQCVTDEDTGDEIVVAGQVLAVKVVGGETTYVTGTLVPEKYINTSLLLTVAEGVEGDIVSSGAFEMRIGTLNSPSLKLTYEPEDDGLGTDLEYIWFVDGVLQENETGSSFMFHPKRYGDAKITCYVSGHVGGSEYFGSQSSATQVVQVKPTSGANITSSATDPSF